MRLIGSLSEMQTCPQVKPQKQKQKKICIFFNNFPRRNIKKTCLEGSIYNEQSTQRAKLWATQSMKWFAFARCQLHLNERSGIICDYKHWSSFRELSAVTLTTFIRLQMRTTYFNLSGSDFFFSFHYSFNGRDHKLIKSNPGREKRSPDFWCSHNNQNNMLKKESLQVLSQCV